MNSNYAQVRKALPASLSQLARVHKTVKTLRDAVSYELREAYAGRNPLTDKQRADCIIFLGRTAKHD